MRRGGGTNGQEEEEEEEEEAGSCQGWADAVGPEVRSKMSREEKKLMQEVELFRKMESEPAVPPPNKRGPARGGGAAGAGRAAMRRVKREVVEEDVARVEEKEEADIAAALALSLQERDARLRGASQSRRPAAAAALEARAHEVIEID